jgi:hypothetical protein
MWHFHTDCLDDAVDLVKRFHYSHRGPSNVQLVVTAHEDGGLFGDYGEARAAIFFSIPPTRWSEDVWELSRLVRDQEATIQLTQLISWAVKWIRKQRSADLLVSFADATEGHHGGIYQAASWNYDDQRDPQNTGLIINGTYVPGRSCNSAYGTRSAAILAERHPEWTIEQRWDDGKHLYWKALDGQGEAKADRLGLKRSEYPKPAEST